jgi:hypothetical protein
LACRRRADDRSPSGALLALDPWALRTLDARPPLALHRRLQHVAAQISSLIADDMMVLGDPDRSRGWHELAGVGADELGDNALRAQVRALAAMLPLYYGDPAHAVQLARSAHRIPLTMPAASTALALALEALALARLGDAHAARRALGTARDAYDRLGDPQRAHSVFGFSEHRLRFYESRTLAMIGDFDAAWSAQDDALAAYAADLIGDRTLVYLDRAASLVRSGDITGGCQLAGRTLLDLPASHRTDIFVKAGHGVAQAVPPEQRQVAAAAEYQELLGSLAVAVAH